MAGAAAILLARSAAPDPTPAPTPAPAAATGASHSAAPVEKPSDLPKCIDCHEEQVKGFAANPHARSHGKASDPEEFCSNCHGDGAEHIANGGDITKIQTFHGLEGAENCLSCHEKSNTHASFSMGFHSNSAAVNCLSCHKVHSKGPASAHLLAKETGPLCQTCHTGIAASFRNKPYTHRLDRGGMILGPALLLLAMVFLIWNILTELRAKKVL